MNFIGTGRRLEPGDIGEAARSIGVETAVLLAFIEVEAAGRGFDNRNRLKNLPERHVFYRELSGAKRDEAVRRGLAYSKWGTKPYPKTSDSRYALLADMISVDQDAALRSTSWGLPQILGNNHLAAGHPHALAMVQAMMMGEREQLLAMTALLKDWGLDKHLRGKDFTQPSSWIPAVSRYNGSGYATHNYHGRIATAYRKHKDGASLKLATSKSILRLGMKGEPVMNMQRDLVALGYDLGGGGADGRFGQATLNAVVAFQEDHGLDVDGRFGPKSRAKLDALLREIEEEVEPEVEWDRGEEPAAAEPEHPKVIAVGDPDPTTPVATGTKPAGGTAAKAIIAIVGGLLALAAVKLGIGG